MNLLKKILIIQLEDETAILQSTPVFRCVKNQVDDIEIHILFLFQFKKVSPNNPFIDKYFYLSNNRTDIISRLRAEGYDYVADLSNTGMSNSITRALKTRVSKIKKNSLRNFLFAKLNVGRFPKRHFAQRCLDTVVPLGVIDDGGGFNYYISKSDEVPESDIPLSHTAGFVAVGLPTAGEIQNFSLQKLKEFCERLRYPVLLIGSNHNKSDAEMIAAADQVKIYSACGKFSSNEMTDLLRKAKVVVSNDAVMTSIACAFKRPVVAFREKNSAHLDKGPYYGTGFNDNTAPALFNNTGRKLHNEFSDKESVDELLRKTLELIYP